MEINFQCFQCTLCPSSPSARSSSALAINSQRQQQQTSNKILKYECSCKGGCLSLQPLLLAACPFLGHLSLFHLPKIQKYTHTLRRRLTLLPCTPVSLRLSSQSLAQPPSAPPPAAVAGCCGLLSRSFHLPAIFGCDAPSKARVLRIKISMQYFCFTNNNNSSARE